jgi:hydroxypyruvate isomerase
MVAWAAEFFAPHGLDVVISDQRTQRAGLFSTILASRAIWSLGWEIPNLKLQFDIYHCQIIHGDVLAARMLPIGHVRSPAFRATSRTAKS